MTEEPRPWYETFDDLPTKALAVRLAIADGFPSDQMAIPFIPQTHALAGGGIVSLIPTGAMAPIWTFYLRPAKVMLDVHAQSLVDEALGGAADDMIEAQAKAKTPDQMWRDDKGLENGT